MFGHSSLTYINYWTEHSSNDSSAEVQGAAVTYYVPSWAAPCPIFICCRNLVQRPNAQSSNLYRAVAQLCHMDTRHFVILECRHLANGCVLKCGCIGLMLFQYLSCLGTIICYINTIGIVPAYACNVCDVLVASWSR